MLISSPSQLRDVSLAPSSLWFALLLVTSLGVVGACDDPLTPEGVSFTVSDTTASTGDTIQLILSNASEHDLGFNLCFAALERGEVVGWISVQRYPDNLFCPDVLSRLPSGASTTYSQVIFPFIEPAVYRFRVTIEWPIDGERVPIISERFRVMR